MDHLTHEIKGLLHNPRLLFQYAILNFFLISVGTAAVVYIKKEAVIEYQVKQGEQIGRAVDGLSQSKTPDQSKDNLKEINQASDNIISASKK